VLPAFVRRPYQLIPSAARPPTPSSHPLSIPNLQLCSRRPCLVSQLYIQYGLSSSTVAAAANMTVASRRKGSARLCHFGAKVNHENVRLYTFQTVTLCSVVDGNLFALSHEKKWIGLLLLPMFFKLVGSSSSGIRTLFDGNCWKCLVNNLSNQSNYLHAAAKTALEACVGLTRYFEGAFL
jgi:DNA polymerase phi